MLILVGNKVDIDDETKTKSKRQVQHEDGMKFKEKHNLNFFIEVSAKSGAGIT
jgi:GTPase SAR1 family protein